ncbi:MAG: tetratricopeptide repeat protein, partial [bacterium]|nr:tetratricopeptide repeat protein [bacterium]
MVVSHVLLMRANRSKKRSRIYAWTIRLAAYFCLIGTLWAQSDILSEHFGAQEDTVAEQLIASLSGPDTAAVYRGLSRTEKGPFLRAFWGRRNPLVLKYYYGYHLGEGHFSVSDAYFEQGDLIAIQFHTGATAPDTQQVSEAVRICETVLAKHPEDRVAQCALGYLRLEQSDVKTAEGLFRKALKDNKRFVEARNGWALAVLKMDMQNQRARNLFRDAVSIDKTYEAALYNLAMCHLALGRLDPAGVDKYFERVVEHFP